MDAFDALSLTGAPDDFSLAGKFGDADVELPGSGDQAWGLAGIEDFALDAVNEDLRWQILHAAAGAVEHGEGFGEMVERLMRHGRQELNLEFIQKPQ